MIRSLPLVLALACLGAQARADDSQRPVHDEEVEVGLDIQRAIESGHAFLVRNQDEHSGAFDSNSEYKLAITAFSCLSLMAGGHLPGRGAYGQNVERGLRFLLDSQSKGGLFWRADDKSRMHGHGYATLAVAEAYGMVESPAFRARLKASLKTAVFRIEQSQTKEGGWGYEAEAVIHEGSVTVIQLQALRAAKDAGIAVSIETIEKAREYLRLSANPDGSFKYRLDHAGSHNSFPLTAAGVASLQAKGDYAAEEVDRGLGYMIQYLPPADRLMVGEDQYYVQFYHYGQFYAAQAMYHAVDRNYWKRWYPAIAEQLMSPGYYSFRQKCWTNSRFGDVFATAISTIVLQIPYKYLPIFQR